MIVEAPQSIHYVTVSTVQFSLTVLIYSEFFSSIRQTFGIPHQRAELREELQDTFSLLESGFLEERRRIKMEEQKEERLEKDRFDF